MARQEHNFALWLSLKAGMMVLDTVWGVGDPATEIANLVDCKVVGLNINAYQLQKDGEIAAAQGISDDVLQLIQGDFLVHNLGTE